MEMITRSMSSEDYAHTRKRAQTIKNFEKIQQILQRDVTRNITKSFTQHTKTLIQQYLESPINNIDNIREASRFLTRVSMVYKKLILYYATMPLYRYTIIPTMDLNEDIDIDNIMPNYQKILKTFHHFKMEKECFNIVSCIIRDGQFTGFMYESDDDGMFLMPLDVQYCRVYGKTGSGEWITYFNAAYFDVGTNKQFVLGVDGDTSGCWDQCFIDGYNQYKEIGRSAQWFRLTPEKTCTIVSGTDDEFYMPLPYFVPLFVSLLQLIDTEAILASKTELQNYKLLLGKIPLMKDSNDIDDFAISLEMVNQFQAIIENSVPDLVGVGVAPYDFEVINFDKSTNNDDTDTLNQYINNLFSNAGVNKLVVSSGSSTNASGIKYSIANDTGNMFIYVRRLESWLNYYIKNNIIDGFELEIFDQTRYNEADFVQMKKEAATLGGSAIDYLCSLGDTPWIAWNKIRFENASKIKEQMIPLMNSYTMSGSNQKAGRPEMPEEDLSEEGVSARVSGKNDDRGT